MVYNYRVACSSSLVSERRFHVEYFIKYPNKMEMYHTFASIVYSNLLNTRHMALQSINYSEDCYKWPVNQKQGVN